MIVLFISLLLMLSKALTLLLFIYVILSWILSPFHPIRQTLSRIIDPILNPIRRWMPQTGPFDFSVLVLFIILQIFESMLRQTLVTLQ